MVFFGSAGNHGTMKAPSRESIVLKAGKQKKVWLMGVSALFVVLGFLMVFAFPDDAVRYTIFFGFMTVVFIVGGLVDTSKGARIVLTGRAISGGTLRRKTIPWDNLGEVWTGNETIEWERSESGRSKAISCQTPYGPLGRECLHNDRQVSRQLAIDWIKALRDAPSETERKALIRKFRGNAPKTLRPLAKLAPVEGAKAEELLEELKHLRGEYAIDRKMEALQYFKEKGWAFPTQGRRTPKVIFGFCILIGVAIFWIFFFGLLISMAFS
jgi:hypothetical protein